MPDELIPTQRLHDIYRAADKVPPPFTEFQLRNGQDLLANGQTTFADLAALFGNVEGGMVLWLTETCFIMNFIVFLFPLPYSYSHKIQFITEEALDQGAEANHKPATSTYYLMAPRTHEMRPAMEVVLELLARNILYSRIHIRAPHPRYSLHVRLPVATAVLERLLSTPVERNVVFYHILFNNDECQVLAMACHENVHLTLEDCRLEDQGQAFAQAIQDNRGPTMLDFDESNPFANVHFLGVCSGLSTNTRLKKLKFFYTDLDEAQVKALALAVGENHGLTSLCLKGNGISTANWTRICESLQHHDTLEHVNLRCTKLGDEPLESADKTSRTLELAQVLRVNTVLKVVDVSTNEQDRSLLQTQVEFRLLLNQYREPVQAIRTETDETIRGSVLGQALASEAVQANPNLLFFFAASALAQPNME